MGTPLRYPAIPLCHGDSVTLYLEYQPLHIPHKIIDGAGAGVKWDEFYGAKHSLFGLI